MVPFAFCMQQWASEGYNKLGQIVQAPQQASRLLRILPVAQVVSQCCRKGFVLVTHFDSRLPQEFILRTLFHNFFNERMRSSGIFMLYRPHFLVLQRLFVRFWLTFQRYGQHFIDPLHWLNRQIALHIGTDFFQITLIIFGDQHMFNATAMRC